jgi:potassium-transporting ATPase KdpC subunit
MKTIKNGLLLFTILFVILGIVYPVAITAISNLVFPFQAGGSLIQDSNGSIIGSELIGQPFSNPGFFWSRPSATAQFPYNSLASGGSNLGPTSSNLQKQLEDNKKILEDSGITNVTSDLLMNSGSGLDPDISLQSALVQIPRIAKLRNISEDKIRNLVIANEEGSIFNSGNKWVNVLQLNIALESGNYGN